MGDFGFVDEISVDTSLVLGFVIVVTTAVGGVTSSEVCVVFDVLKPD